MHDTPCSSVSVVDFKQVIAGWDICLLERLFFRNNVWRSLLGFKNPRNIFFKSRQSSSKLPVEEFISSCIIDFCRHL